MDQNLKNRLVGIVVIFSLAVIFLPMILDGSGVRQRQVEVVIPPKPDIKPKVNLQQKVEAAEQRAASIPQVTAAVVDESSPEEVVAEPEPESEPAAVDPEPAPEPKSETTTEVVKPGGVTWVLQVGSFQDRSKALAERDRVRKSDIAAVFVEQFDLNGKATYRVRLGPFVNRDRARVAQNKIKAKYNIDGIILKYER